MQTLRYTLRYEPRNVLAMIHISESQNISEASNPVGTVNVNSSVVKLNPYLCKLCPLDFRSERAVRYLQPSTKAKSDLLTILYFFINIFQCDLPHLIVFIIFFSFSANKWSIISIQFLGEAEIQTHVQGGLNRESSVFTTRPGVSPINLYFLSTT